MRSRARIFVAVCAAVLAALMAVQVGGCANKGAAGGAGAGSVAVGDEGAAPDAGSSAQANGQPESKGEHPMVEITMESGGVISVELDPEAAPITVENFLALVDQGFYDGLTFHRVIDGFMVQGGDPSGNGTGGAPDNIKGEFASNGWDNPISHARGIISMARSQDFNSASSQFFITNGDATFLDGQYAAFGTVTAGMDVVDSIAQSPKDGSGMPLEPVVIKSIKRV